MKYRKIKINTNVRGHGIIGKAGVKTLCSP
jgi:hypothetical protein